MNRMLLLRRLFEIAVMLSSVSTPLLAGVITYHPESGIYAGNGCPEGSSRIYVDEYGDLVLEHDAMILSLPAYGQDPALSGRRACTIRIPVTIPQGFYISAIEQRIAYAAIKSEGAQAQISTQTSFSSDRVSPFTAILPRDEEFTGDLMIDSRRNQLNSQSQINRYCRGDRSEEMMLRINMAMSGQRDSYAEDLIVQTIGGYISEGIDVEVSPCP